MPDQSITQRSFLFWKLQVKQHRSPELCAPEHRDDEGLQRCHPRQEQCWGLRGLELHPPGKAQQTVQMSEQMAFLLSHDTTKGQKQLEGMYTT